MGGKLRVSSEGRPWARAGRPAGGSSQPGAAPTAAAEAGRWCSGSLVYIQGLISGAVRALSWPQCRDSRAGSGSRACSELCRPQHRARPRADSTAQKLQARQLRHASTPMEVGAEIVASAAMPTLAHCAHQFMAAAAGQHYKSRARRGGLCRAANRPACPAHCGGPRLPSTSVMSPASVAQPAAWMRRPRH